VSPKFTLAVAN